MITLYIIALAIVLFLGLRTFSTYFYILVTNGRVRSLFGKLFPIIELILWVWFTLWIVYRETTETPLNAVVPGIVVVVLLLLFVWYFGRDLVCGVILKAENGFEAGQMIQTVEGYCTIKKAGYRSLEVSTKEGMIIRIPYSVISRKPIVLPVSNVKGAEHRITLKVFSTFPPEKINTMLKGKLLEMPWVVSGENIKIEITREDADSYKVMLDYHALSPEMALKAEDYLLRFIKEWESK